MNCLVDPRMWQVLFNGEGKVKNWHRKVMTLLEVDDDEVRQEGKLALEIIDHCYVALGITGTKEARRRTR